VSVPRFNIPLRSALIVSAVILLSLFVRFRLRDMPLERDEGEYAYAGQLMLEGIPPYKLAYNMKLPGTYAAYALIMAIFGQTPSGIHVGLALVNCASILLMYFLGRKLLDDTAGVVAAITFGLLSLSPSVLGLAGHATHFVVLPALAATLLLLRATEGKGVESRKSSDESQKPKASAEPSMLDARPPTASAGPSTRSAGRSTLDARRSTIFSTGLLFGVAFIMKQQGVFFGIFGGLYLILVPLGRYLEERDIRKRNYGRLPRGSGEPVSWKTVFGHVAVYSAGCIIPYLLTCLILWAGGVFPQFWFWTVDYAAQYASNRPIFDLQALLRSTLSVAVGASSVLWAVGLLGLVVIWWDNRLSVDRRTCLTLFFVCSLLSVSIGLYFRGHYFITLLPALSLLSAVAVTRSLWLLKHNRTIELFLAVPISAAFAIGILATLIGNGAVWFVMKPDEAMHYTYGTTLFTEARQIGHYIRDHSQPKAAIAVIGSEPEIYFYAHRHSATGYIYLYPLMEVQPFASKMQQEMIAEIEKNNPEFVVYVDDNFSWLTTPASQRKIDDWWPKFLEKHLTFTSRTEIQGREDERLPVFLRNDNNKTQTAAARALLLYQFRT
jgi:4-amino-4-deoxy-L-arabinose transferase-like glycosyltransferase